MSQSQQMLVDLRSKTIILPIQMLPPLILTDLVDISIALSTYPKSISISPTLSCSHSIVILLVHMEPDANHPTSWSLLGDAAGDCSEGHTAERDQRAVLVFLDPSTSEASCFPCSCCLVENC